MASQQLLDGQPVINCVEAAPANIGQRRGLLQATGRVLAWLELAWSIRRERRELSRLPDSLRRDIGVSDAQVSRESSQPWFAIPANRLRR